MESRNVQYYDKKTVGSRIRQMRKNKGLTQCMLADQLDYSSERQLQRIESGETACSVDKLMEIAQILNTSTDFLLFGQSQLAIDVLDTILKIDSEGQKIFLLKLIEIVINNWKLIEK